MFFSPSELICVDESMSRWYGLGGEWLDIGLPTYRAIDRKPENGCEIKKSACGKSGIMMRLIVVKSPEEDARCDENSGINHGAAMTRRLVEPWKKKRIESFVWTLISHLLPQFKSYIALECIS